MKGSSWLGIMHAIFAVTYTLLITIGVPHVLSAPFLICSALYGCASAIVAAIEGKGGAR